MHAMLLRFASCIPVLILKSQTQCFSKHHFSQIIKFGVLCAPGSRWTIPLLHSLYQWDKTFCFLFWGTQFRNWTILFSETLMAVLNIAVAFNVSWKQKMCLNGTQNSKLAGPWKNVSYVICEQQRRRSACASAQSEQRLCCSLLR